MLSDDEFEVGTALVFERFRIHHALYTVRHVLLFVIQCMLLYNFEAGSFYATYNVMRSNFRMQLSTDMLNDST